MRLSPTSHVTPTAAGSPKSAHRARPRRPPSSVAPGRRNRRAARERTGPAPRRVRSAAIAQPGAHDHTRVLQPEEDVVTLLGLTRRPRCHTTGQSVILHPRVAALMMSSAVWYWSCSSVTSRSTSILRARNPFDVSVMCCRVNALMTVAKKTTPGHTELVRGLVGAQTPAADDEVRRPVEQGSEEAGDLGGVVLTVGVEGDDIAGPVGDGELVAQAQGDALSHVDRQHGTVGPVRRRCPRCRRPRRRRRPASTPPGRRPRWERP